MSNYVQFRVGRLEQKIEGKLYKKDDLFPYDATNPKHKQMYDQGVLVAENVEPKEAVKAEKVPTKTTKKGSRK